MAAITTGSLPFGGTAAVPFRQPFVGEGVQLCRQTVPIGVVLPALQNSS